MATVNTVLGPISPADLGITLVHEHIAASYPGWECDPLTRPYNPDKMVALCVRNLMPVKEFGVRTIIDATPVDLSRNVEVMKGVSEKLEINIVCSTGRYTEEEGKWAYLKIRSKNKIGDMRTELYEGMMHEIEKGIGQSGVKPGVIKVATGQDHISEVEEAVLRAAARASKETGIPVITHTENGTMGPDQAEILVGEGADPRRVMIGHMCGNPSLEYQVNVLDKGVSISFDRFGLEQFVPDRVRTAALAGLLGIGFADRIMLSQDFIASAFGRGGTRPEELIRKVVNWAPVNIFKNILPALKKAAVTDAQIHSMMVENPRRLLSGE